MSTDEKERTGCSSPEHLLCGIWISVFQAVWSYYSLQKKKHLTWILTFLMHLSLPRHLFSILTYWLLVLMTQTEAKEFFYHLLHFPPVNYTLCVNSAASNENILWSSVLTPKKALLRGEKNTLFLPTFGREHWRSNLDSTRLDRN